jgi:thiol-disulfide isomerase/thioredoxin
VLAAALLFVLVRLGPQLGALTGVGPDLGRVPEFRVTTLSGETLGSESLQGRVVVVNFWATWCPPCRLEIPALQALHEDADPDDVTVLGLSTDRGGRSEVEAFLDERGVTFPVAMADGDVRRAFGGIAHLPTTFVIDREGVVRHRVFGFFAPPALRAAVNRLVEASPLSTEPAAAAP